MLMHVWAVICLEIMELVSDWLGSSCLKTTISEQLRFQLLALFIQDERVIVDKIK